jgi:hypothetical protein
MNSLPKDIFDYILHISIYNGIYNVIYINKEWHNHCIALSIFNAKKVKAEETNNVINFIVNMSKAPVNVSTCNMNLIRVNVFKSDIDDNKQHIHYSISTKNGGGDWSMFINKGSINHISSCVDRTVLWSEIRKMLELSDDIAIVYKYLAQRKCPLPPIYLDNIGKTSLGKHLTYSEKVGHPIMFMPSSIEDTTNDYCLTTRLSTLRTAFANDKEFVTVAKRHFNMV